MKKTLLFSLALFAFVPSFAQGESTVVSDYLLEEFPFEFIARKDPTSPGTEWHNQKGDYIVSGVDVWFKPHWWHLPCPIDFTVNQTIERADGNTFLINVHVNSRLFREEKEKEIYYKGINVEPASLIGRLNAGRYVIILSIVDDAGELYPNPLEIPFTVKDNPVIVPNGLVYVGSGMDYLGENKEKLRYADGDYKPNLCLSDESDDSLRVVGWLNYTCCMDHYCYYEIHGDSVYLETVQAGYYDMCDCRALHPVDFKIGPYNAASKCSVGTWEYGLGAHALRIDVTSVPYVKEDDIPLIKNYDLQGRPADETQKGVIVKNGKKMLVR